MTKNAPNPGGGREGSASDEGLRFESPLAIRRGQADPTDIDDTPLTLGFSELNYDANPRLSLPPVEEWREAVPPDETWREPEGPKEPPAPQAPIEAMGAAEQ